MPALMQNATPVTATPLWDLATGARHFLICHRDSEVRTDALAALFATVSGLPDVTVWADHSALDSVKLPDDLSYGYWAAGSKNAVDMLGLAVELADARTNVLEDANRWLFRPTRRSRLILVVADFTAVDADDLSRGLLALDRLLAKGRRTAMPAVVIADPDTAAAAPLQRATRTCVSWLPAALATDSAEQRELATASR
jgi:hypothetical protein